MNPCLITPARAAASDGPQRLLEACTAQVLTKMVLAHMWRFWARPEQLIPDDGWTWYMLVGGRGWGKSWATACFINEQVLRGKVEHVALMSTNEARVEQTQIQMLIATAPPWCRPVRDKRGLLWPNGVRAIAFTPEAPEAVRSENIELAWLNEIVAWPATKRLRAFENISTASRTGRARIIIDTTASGRNDVRRTMNAMNAQDPLAFRMIHGTLLDNPLLSREYIRSQYLLYTEGSRRFQEEIMGESFDDAAGALWSSETVDQTRRLVAPSPLDIVILGLDPAYSNRADSDETGLIAVGRKGADVFVTHDLSGRMNPETWSELAVQTAIDLRASGIVIEVNSTVDTLPTIMRSACKTHGLVMVELGRAERFGPHRPGVLYLKRITSRKDKYARAAGPAGEFLAHRAHLVGELPELEHEMCTHEPESKDHSPGRLDAMVHAVNELAGLTMDGAVDAGPGVIGSAVAAKRLGQLLAAPGSRRVGM